MLSFYVATNLAFILSFDLAATSAFMLCFDLAATLAFICSVLIWLHLWLLCYPLLDLVGSIFGFFVSLFWLLLSTCFGMAVILASVVCSFHWLLLRPLSFCLFVFHHQRSCFCVSSLFIVDLSFLPFIPKFTHSLSLL